MCSRIQLAYGLMLAAAVAFGSLLTGCTGDDKPLVSTKEETSFGDVQKNIEDISDPRAGERENAIVELQRAHAAGALDLPPEEMEKLKLTLNAKANNDVADVKREARKLLDMLAAGEGGEGAADGAPTE